MANAPEPLALWIESMAEDGKTIPRARTPSELKADPEVAADMAAHAIALIPAPRLTFQPAAE